MSGLINIALPIIFFCDITEKSFVLTGTISQSVKFIFISADE